jgi:hypothetical protein
MIQQSGILFYLGLLFCGDLNFTVASSEIWGGRARPDALDGYFGQMMVDYRLIDMLPGKLSPTWRNGRSDSGGIGKRLDRFLVAEDLMGKMDRVRSWVVNSDISDHCPICLQFEVESIMHMYPFKFNEVWLDDCNFLELVHSHWEEVDLDPEESTMRKLVRKLSSLKKRVISWEKEKKKGLQMELVEIEDEIEDILAGNFDGVFSNKDLDKLKSLSSRKVEILKIEEDTWRLKSRAIWIKQGDNNTKLFHVYADYRRKQNAIWDILTDGECWVSSSKDLHNEAIKYFSELFRDPGNDNIISQLCVVQQYPRFFTDEEGGLIGKEVLLEEVESALKSFAKSKSPGPDGWPVEFFLSFFDILGKDLVDMVEEIRKFGNTSGEINSTFISLILKSGRPESFKDFRPISLCNLIYKLNSKIIANIIKPFLSHFMSKEQFGFLENRHIMEAIGLAQEGLHSIKTKKMKDLILKMDLVKAYDRVNWNFLRLVLLQIGLPLNVTNWIMGNVSSACFSVLINGNPTNFFKGSRGIRQGFPLSPLLFLLVIEGLSILIKNAKRDGKLSGIKLCSGNFITHLLFVDDILIFGNGSVSEWHEFSAIFKLFCEATGMEVSPSKSTFLCHDISQEILNQIQSFFFPFNDGDFESGMKYLGFLLKPNKYLVKDWYWLIKKVEHMINVWCYRWLSLGGRITLVNYVLSNILVYWFSLVVVPSSIIKTIRSKIFQFLWSGAVNQKSKIHLTSWESISKPKVLGGWGIKNIKWFNIALVLKTIWIGLSGNGLWGEILRAKYF